MRNVTHRFAVPWLVAGGLALLTSTGTCRSQVRLFSLEGSATGDQLGSAVASVGDVNQDNHDDFAAAAPGADRNGRDSGTIVVLHGLSGRPIHTLHGDGENDRLGASLSGAGDVDADGHPDLIASMGGGRARVFSGKDGRVLYTFTGDSPGDGFGTAVAGAGDIDRDGHADLLVGIPKAAPGGAVRVLSGKNGSILFTIPGLATSAGLGGAVAGVGDVDRDGWPDFAAGAPTYLIPHVQVFSGRDGHEIQRQYAWYVASEFGSCIAALGDIDGDGHADYAVGSPRDRTRGTNAGIVFVYSGKAGNLLFVEHGAEQQLLGRSVTGVGDVDKDGTPDFAAGISSFGWGFGGAGAGAVRVWSGKDGAEIYTHLGARSNGWFGTAVGGGGDADADGFPDLVVGMTGEDKNGAGCGSAIVFSGRQVFTADRQTLSLSQGGTVTLAIDGGFRFSRQAYVVLGSTSGTVPAVPLGPVVLPLNAFDSYFGLTLHPNSVITGSVGLLGETGRGQAQLTIPPGTYPGLEGLVLHHACVVIWRQPIQSQFAFASSAIPLRLVK